MLSKGKRKLPFTRPKTPQELRATRKAVAIARKALALDPFGKTEKQAAREIIKTIQSQGAGLAFRPIVSTGRNTRLIHHRPGDRIIRRENPLMIDLGARYQGQCSDITRMHLPRDEKIRKIYRDALNIQGIIIRKLRPGIQLKDLNDLYKKIMKSKGYRVKHSIGHGLGARIHERIGELKPGMVLTVEPGIYTKNMGCRIEDMVLIKRTGIEILSDSIPKPFKA
jgi:Xaa-Pro aminopeptidase